MTLKIAKIFIVVFTVILFCGAVYIGMRNISYFNVTEVETGYIGPVSAFSPDLDRIIGPLKGLNIFEINVNQLRSQIESFGGVESVMIKRFFPGKLKITITFTDYAVRNYFTKDDITYYFLADKNSIVEVDKNTFDFFSPLLAVELNSDYGLMLLKWGTDTGFSQMVELSKLLANNTLINYAKYVNTNSNEFGCFILEMNSVFSELSIQDPVKQDRLLEVLNIIIRNYVETSGTQNYDLYSNALVKRV